MKRIMIGATVVVILVVSLTAQIAYGQGPTTTTTTTTPQNPPPPPNDNYLLSTIIPASQNTSTNLARYGDKENTANATVQSDLFNPEQNGLSLFGGGRESLTCQGTSFGRTIWYDLHPKIPEGVQLQVTGFPNVIVVYQYSRTSAKITHRVGCQVQNSTAPNTYDPPELFPSKGYFYTVQIGGIDTTPGDSSTAAGGSLHFSAIFVPDHDGDGTYDAQDACPFLAGVRQFGGCPPTLDPTLHYGAAPGSGELTLSQLAVESIPGETKVVARCSCGISQSATAAAQATSVSLPAFSKKIRFGSTLDIWVTMHAHGNGIYKYGAIGAYLQYRAGPHDGLGQPIKKCLMPGSMSPQSQCPPGGRKPAIG